MRPLVSASSMSRSLIYMDNLHGWTGYTGLFDESFHRLEKEEPFAKFARKRDLLSGRVVVPGKPMASQVQIPFEGVILQEHSAPISCPTPNFAKGSEVNEILGAETMRTHCNS